MDQLAVCPDLTQPNPGYDQSAPAELNQPIDKLVP
jgi:hypothetical protein